MFLLFGIVKVEVEVGDCHSRVRLVLRLDVFNSHRTIGIFSKLLIMYLCRIITKGYFSHS
jgi:hypothetical protein